MRAGFADGSRVLIRYVPEPRSAHVVAQPPDPLDLDLDDVAVAQPARRRRRRLLPVCP